MSDMKYITGNGNRESRYMRVEVKENLRIHRHLSVFIGKYRYFSLNLHQTSCNHGQINITCLLLSSCLLVYDLDSTFRSSRSTRMFRTFPKTDLPESRVDLWGQWTFGLVPTRTERKRQAHRDERCANQLRTGLATSALDEYTDGLPQLGIFRILRG